MTARVGVTVGAEERVEIEVGEVMVVTLEEEMAETGAQAPVTRESEAVGQIMGTGIGR
jgi:hypothetical protein